MKWRQVISHDLWQPRHLPRFLSAARRVMMAQPPPNVIMTTQNISPPLKKSQSFWYYIYQPSHKEEGKLDIPSKRPTDLSFSLTMANKTIGGCVRTPHPDAFCRWNDWIKNLYWLRSCVHPFGNYVDHQGRETSTLCSPLLCTILQDSPLIALCEFPHWLPILLSLWIKFICCKSVTSFSSQCETRPENWP